MADQPTSRLMSLADLNPARWKPMNYAVSIDVPVAANTPGQGVIQLNNQPIFISRIALLLVGNVGDPETSGLYDDGQMMVTMTDDQRNYQNVPILADLLWGPKTNGPFRTLEYPIFYAGGRTVRFELFSTYTRVLTPVSDTFRAQILMAGLADWGPVTSNLG
jgi:hypothetical protein